MRNERLIISVEAQLSMITRAYLCRVSCRFISLREFCGTYGPYCLPFDYLLASFSSPERPSNRPGMNVVAFDCLEFS
jgi:hypothetical protein